MRDSVCVTIANNWRSPISWLSAIITAKSMDFYFRSPSQWTGYRSMMWSRIRRYYWITFCWPSRFKTNVNVSLMKTPWTTCATNSSAILALRTAMNRIFPQVTTGYARIVSASVFVPGVSDRRNWRRSERTWYLWARKKLEEAIKHRI